MNIHPYGLRTAMLGVMAAAATSCQDAAVQAPLGSIAATVHLQDQGMTPISGVYIVAQAWQGTSATYVATGLSDPSGDYQLPDSGGLTRPWDSLTIDVPSEWCSGLGARDTVLREPLAGSAANLTLTLQRTAQPAKLVPGESCGIGHADFAPGVLTGFWINLQIDSITDSVRGRWQVTYQESRRSEYGTFAGSQVGSMVKLALEPAPVFGGCLPRYSLLAPVAADSSLGVAHLETNGGCPIYGDPVRMVGFDDPTFP